MPNHTVTFFSSDGPEEKVVLNTLTDADMDRLRLAVLHREMWFTYFGLAINLHNCALIDASPTVFNA